MIELPEARTIAKDLRKEILGKTIVSVGGNFTDHKFTFYHDDPNKYDEQIVAKKVTDIIDRNFYIEIEIEDYILLMRDGANIRYYDQGQAYPEKSKLLIEFDDGSFLNVTTSMYSFIGLYKKGDIDNKYYDLEVNGIGALDKAFSFDYFKSLINEKTLKLSVKAFLATEQRILGIGNGVVQDIMYNAGLHPKRKINTLGEKDIENLYNAIISTLTAMMNQGGRDTEKTIYGKSGGYHMLLSSKSYKDGCPACNSAIKKEQYLGGSIYYCPNCQK
jgi:formamidopyrimidine-DNA glycosylase